MAEIIEIPNFENYEKDINQKNIETIHICSNCGNKRKCITNISNLKDDIETNIYCNKCEQLDKIKIFDIKNNDLSLVEVKK